MCCVRAQPRIYVSVMLCEHLNLYLRKCHYEKAEIALIYIPFSKHIINYKDVTRSFLQSSKTPCVYRAEPFWTYIFPISCRENGEDRPSDGISGPIFFHFYI